MNISKNNYPNTDNIKSAKDLINVINQAKTDYESIIITYLAQSNPEISDNEWNNILLTTSASMNISVEDLLEKIEYRNSFDYFLENEAEEQYWQMMSAENSTYGCDIDEHY